jgi:hypothetical protein
MLCVCVSVRSISIAVTVCVYLSRAVAHRVCVPGQFFPGAGVVRACGEEVLGPLGIIHPARRETTPPRLLRAACRRGSRAVSRGSAFGKR